MDNYLTVAKTADLPASGALEVSVAGRKLVLCELEGEYFAIDAECPHRGGPLGACPPENGHLVCPMHGWQFDIRTGTCPTRPDRPARTYPTRVVHGQIQVLLEK